MYSEVYDSISTKFASSFTRATHDKCEVAA